MTPTEIQTKEARANFSELLNQVYYTGSQFRIMKRNKGMARLVPEPLVTAIESILADDPALADTLELMLNQNLRQEVEESLAEAKAGHTRSADEFFQEI